MNKISLNTVSIVALSLLFSASVNAAKPVKPGSGSDSAPHHPVLFVHGYMSGGYVWDTMLSRFKADGWSDGELFSWSYDYNQSNVTTAQEIKAKVDQILAATGAAKVDIITHSMGGLSSRYFAKFLGGDTKIDAWVSLAGPNHGTNWGYNCFSTSCYDMRPGSSFLTNLNNGDETPGAPRYATYWSPCDDIIDPDDSVLLNGASNNKTACISHNWFLQDEAVYQKVRNFVSN